MNNILLYIANLLIISSYILYLFMIFISKRRKIGDTNGFDITKDIISEYNSINIIENKSYFTIYNLKRKVIKIASSCYYGNSVSDISLPLIEAGISVVDDNKNKFINLIRIFFSNLKLLYIFPILAIFINYSSYNVSDAKVSLIFIIIFSVITYMLVDIKSLAYTWIVDNLGKLKTITNENKDRIFKFIDRVILFDKLIFFGYLIMIIRFVLILISY